MQPYFEDSTVRLYHGDCIDVMASLPDNSVDSVVCDPPYGLANTTPEQVADTLVRWINGERDYLPTGQGFMGKAWDAFVPPVAVWDDCLRVLKPGGHLLAFAGSRTHDLMTLAIRMAGFEVRDSIAWLYGSGFPKSLDVSKAIDAYELTGGKTNSKSIRAATLGREVMGVRADFKAKKAAEAARGVDNAHNFNKQHNPTANGGYSDPGSVGNITAPATPAAQQWQGWGTALKPAFEPIVVARKPLAGTVAANVLEWGTGALNVDGTRVESDGSHMVKGTVTKRTTVSGDERTGKALGMYGAGASFTPTNHEGGRWPANVLLDGSQAGALDADNPTTKSRVGMTQHASNGADAILGARRRTAQSTVQDGTPDEGGVSRYFPTFRYQAKAPTRERPSYTGPDGDKIAHPTTKPLALMQWLVRLVTPPGGVVLEPFAGSGTTVEACLLEGFRCIAIEREADYLPLIEARIARATSLPATDEDAPPTLFDATA